MRVRIILSAACQKHRRIIAESMIGAIQRRMLAGEDDRRKNPPALERFGDGLELDGFGTRTDDQNDATGQPSP